MSLIKDTTARYELAINELNVQIDLPALATPVQPQREYNRRKRMELTGVPPKKHVAGLKLLVIELSKEKDAVLKGIEAVCRTIVDADYMELEMKEKLLKEVGYYETP